MNNKFKKFRPLALFGVISVLAVLFFFDIHYAHAGVWDLIWNTTKNGIATLAAYILYYLVFMPISGVFWAAGQFFNVCVAISLNSEVFNTKMVVDGWAISRDVANLFFIFILLYIAIATILQLSNYGTKQLLGKIIIIALLVNFSLLITRVIVDSSNILALEFYDSISVEGGTATSIMAGGTAKDLSQVFVSGFNPQNLLKSKNFASTIDEGVIDTLLVVVVSMLLASILVLVAAFVLFAAGILFVIRTVTLWLLMVLAPLAFLAMTLPATKGHASKWWTKLFEQSFFAPVFMFLFYLVAKIIDSGFLNNMVTSIDVGGGVSEGFKETFSTFAVVSIQFVFLGALMIACLVIAKQMGAYGATTMQSWGQSARKWGQGYAGKVALRRLSPLAREMESGKAQERSKYNPMRLPMWAARKAGKAAPYIPGAQAGLQTLGTHYGRDVEDRAKNLDKFSSDELSRRIKIATLPVDRAAIMKKLTERGDIGKLNDVDVRKGKALLSNVGMAGAIKDIDRLRPDLAGTSAEIKKAVSYQNPEHVAKLNKSLSSNNDVIEGMLDHYKAGHISALVNRGDELFAEYAKALEALDASGAKNTANIAAALRSRKNEGAAKWIETTTAKQLLGLS
ncbi:type IV secretion system protein [Patescibacteria group bacterium]|nr:type IV secretion system protein [Patescibacteria group bacterium]MBU4353505.1 type IV secretion system protein [Patescibacteria group bacterium]MBU4477419.1 type IV secretion system protein [Patescibacteria group bacterium]MCG2699418.1 type IV secretion system protein [Candidatus Parcubacteria bacterium]